MKKFLSDAEQSRFQELQIKLSQLLITETEQAELTAIVSRVQKLAADRRTAIESVRKTVAQHALAVNEIFTDAEIRRSITKPVREKSEVAAKKPSKNKRISESKQLLIQVKLDKGAGAPSRYKKGQTLGKFVSRNFKQLDVNGRLAENLLQHATTEGKAYFATESGKAEFDSLVQYIQRTPVKA